MDIISRHDLVPMLHRPDGDIAAEIAVRLDSARHAPEDHQVRFTVRNGVVTLTGRVRREGDVVVVQRLVADVPGVVGVEGHVAFGLADQL